MQGLSPKPRSSACSHYRYYFTVTLIFLSAIFMNFLLFMNPNTVTIIFILFFVPH